jgi:hypothetical protein
VALDILKSKEYLVMPMKQNVGKVDKIIRLIVAVVLAALGFYLKIWWLYIFAAAALITGVLGYCYLYTLLGMNTCPVKKAVKEVKEAKPKKAKKGKKK